MYRSFIANDLIVDGAIDVSTSQPAEWLRVTRCSSHLGITVAGLFDEIGGGVHILDCQTSGSIRASGLQPNIDGCELTGSGNIQIDGSDSAGVSGCTVLDGEIEVSGRDYSALAINNVVVGGNITVGSSTDVDVFGNVVHGGGINAAGDHRVHCARNMCFDGPFGLATGPAKDSAILEDNLVVRCSFGILGGDVHTVIRSNTVVDCVAEGIRSSQAGDEVEQNIVVGCGVAPAAGSVVR